MAMDNQIPAERAPFEFAAGYQFYYEEIKPQVVNVLRLSDIELNALLFSQWTNKLTVQERNLYIFKAG